MPDQQSVASQTAQDPKKTSHAHSGHQPLPLIAHAHQATPSATQNAYPNAMTASSMATKNAMMEVKAAASKIAQALSTSQTAHLETLQALQFARVNQAMTTQVQQLPRQFVCRFVGMGWW